MELSFPQDLSVVRDNRSSRENLQAKDTTVSLQTPPLQYPPHCSQPKDFISLSHLPSMSTLSTPLLCPTGIAAWLLVAMPHLLPWPSSQVMDVFSCS